MNNKAQDSGTVVLAILIIIILLIIFIAGAPAIIAVVGDFTASSDDSLINLITQFYIPFAIAMIFLLLFTIIKSR